MITTVFTSQIFAHSIFYSPMSIMSINILQIANLITIMVEHLPQLIVQIIVIFIKLKKYNSIVIATLIVTAIDIIFMTVKAIVWITLHFHTKDKLSRPNSVNVNDI